MAQYQILIDNIPLGGFAPKWYGEQFPSFGNKNQAGAMVNIDMTQAGYITQGPGLSTLTNGTEAGVVTTLLKGISDQAVTSGVTYGTGGNKLYNITSSTVTTSGTWPHTIDKGAVTAEVGEDVALYQGNLYYTYNHSGSAGDIGKFDLASTFDDDWGSTVPSGNAALQNDATSTYPHQIIVGGNDTMYIANGRYVCSYDGTTLIPQALDLPTGTVIQSIAWMSDRLWIAANKTTFTGSNKNAASIYVWDGAANSWEAEIKLNGTVGALHNKNGVMFVWHTDITSTGGYKLSYVSGSGLTDSANYTGGVPAFYQVTEYKDFLIWNSNGDIFAYGSGDKDLPVRLFQFCDGGYSTVGGMSSAFGTPIIASNQSTSYKLATLSGYDVNSSWKSLNFDITGSGKVTKVEYLRFNFDTLQTGARLDFSLVDNQGHTIYSDTLSYAKLGAKTTCYYPLNGKVAENFRIQLDYSNGSTSNTVKLKNIKVYGSYA